MSKFICVSCGHVSDRTDMLVQNYVDHFAAAYGVPVRYISPPCCPAREMQPNPETMPVRILARFHTHSDKDFEGTPCWVWVGEQNRNGYGRLWFEGKRHMAHRWVYEFFYGPIQEGLVLDHRCRNRICSSPLHTEPVTHLENTLRGEAVLFKPVSRET